MKMNVYKKLLSTHLSAVQKMHVKEIFPLLAFIHFITDIPTSIAPERGLV